MTDKPINRTIVLNSFATIDEQEQRMYKKETVLKAMKKWTEIRLRESKKPTRASNPPPRR